MFLIFDTETTGLPKDYNAPLTDSDNWPRLVQIAWQLHDETGTLLEVNNYIVKPEGFTIPYSAEKIHGISTEKALKDGKELHWVLEEFNRILEKTKFLAGHNVEFDISITGAEFLRKDIPTNFLKLAKIDTKEEGTDYCALPGGRGGKFKWPNLKELHIKLFGNAFEEAHNASADVVATARCFFELLRLGIIDSDKNGLSSEFTEDFKKHNPDIIQAIDLKIESNKDSIVPEDLDSDGESDAEISDAEAQGADVSIPFTHLHVHTQYSILDGAADIAGLMNKAKADGMVALAITDHGNMFGIKEFYNIARKKGIKPILGCF